MKGIKQFYMVFKELFVFGNVGTNSIVFSDDSCGFSVVGHFCSC